MAARKFTRPTDTRNLRRVFWIVSEGTVTEPQYFNHLNKILQNSKVHIKVSDPKHSSPIYLQKQMKKLLSSVDEKRGDRAWIVMDRDNWSTEDLTHLANWIKETQCVNMAVSVPRFEVWILLHFRSLHANMGFEKLNDICSEYWEIRSKQCPTEKIDLEMVGLAIDRAKALAESQCQTSFRVIGTTVYKLVEEILQCQR